MIFCAVLCILCGNVTAEWYHGMYMTALNRLHTFLLMKPANGSGKLGDCLYVLRMRLMERFGRSYVRTLDYNLFTHFGVRLSDAVARPETFHKALGSTVSAGDKRKIEREVDYAKCLFGIYD